MILIFHHYLDDLKPLKCKILEFLFIDIPLAELGWNYVLAQHFPK